MAKETINIKVAGKSNVKGVAGSITKSLEDNKEVELTAIGASAVNQSIKAIAMARGFMSVKGHDLYVAPGFGNTHIGGEEVTSIKLVLKLM